MPNVTLLGCTTEPLSAYLKALGVLRLVAKQSDPQATGWWDHGVFHLRSSLDREGIIDFFSNRYQPSPLIGPWGARSGFYAGSAEMTAREALERIRKSPNPRLAPLQKIIAEMVALLSRHELTRKPQTDQDKVQLMQLCRWELSDEVLSWLDAVYTLSNDWRGFAPLLGTGANEGSQGYASTFAQMLLALEFDKTALSSDAAPLIQEALFGGWTRGYVVAPAGQYDPGRAGGFNQGTGIEQKNFPVNPWNVVLAFEGSLLWSCSATRSLHPGFTTMEKGKGSVEGFSSPFTVRSRAVGYDSSVGAEEAQTRAEIWMPLWNHPVGLSELEVFLREGRVEIGRRRARHGLEFAEAVSSLGVDRGVKEFVRYTLIPRRGQSYVALPSGRLPVTARRETDLVQELYPLLQRLDTFLRSFQKHGKEVPAQLQVARRGIDIALYAVLSQGGATRIKNLLAACGRVEKILAIRDLTQSPKISRPITGLSPRWLVLADDGRVELRLAAALASIKRTEKVGPLRANLTWIDPMKPWQWDVGRGQVTWQGNTLASRLRGVLARRMMDGERLACPSNPLAAEIKVHQEDVAAFLSGDLVESLLEDLVFGLTWMRWDQTPLLSQAWHMLGPRWRRPVISRVVPRAWVLLKLLFLPAPFQGPGKNPVKIRPEAAILSLLGAGRVREACRIAQRRLYVSGLSPLRLSFPDQPDGERLAAGLLFPVQDHQIPHIAQLVLHHQQMAMTR